MGHGSAARASRLTHIGRPEPEAATVRIASAARVRLHTPRRGLIGAEYNGPAWRPRPSNCAFRATTMVDADISTAPSAGESKFPAGANTPAASGIATAL